MKFPDKIFQAENEQNPPHDHWFDKDGTTVCPYCFEQLDLPIIPKEVK
jgi:hypothetical protein